jgi:transitional endoplasmic reticulum ATPase
MQALASSNEIAFLSINGASIYSPYVGDAEAFIRETFRKARIASPSILFLDEIDAIVGKREFGISIVSIILISFYRKRCSW